MLTNTENKTTPLERFLTLLIEDDGALDLAIGDQLAKRRSAVLICADEGGLPLPPGELRKTAGRYISFTVGDQPVNRNTIVDGIEAVARCVAINKLTSYELTAACPDFSNIWIHENLMTDDQMLAYTNGLLGLPIWAQTEGSIPSRRVIATVNSLSKSEIAAVLGRDPYRVLKQFGSYLTPETRHSLLEIAVDLGIPAKAEAFEIADYAIERRGGLWPGTLSADMDIYWFTNVIADLIAQDFDFSKYSLTAPMTKALLKVKPDRRPRELRLLLPKCNDQTRELVSMYTKNFNVVEVIFVGMDPSDVKWESEIPYRVTSDYHLLTK